MRNVFYGNVLRIASCMVVVWSIVFSGISFAQDIHFSQFYQAPARLNPALTGKFMGGYRLSGIYRTQWGSVTVPYETVNLSGDARDFANVGGLGMGADLFYDKAGDGNLGTFSLNVSSSYTFGLLENGKHHMTFGAQVGWAKKQIDPSQLVFDNTGNSGEAFETGFSYMNVNAGVVWETQFTRRNKLQLGLAVHNLTQPSYNFFTAEENELDLRFTVHGLYKFMLTENLDFIPGFNFQSQGPHSEFDAGMNVKYTINQRKSTYRAVYLGLWTRANDAAYIVAAMDYNRLNVGMSYDINYSSLQVASRSRGAFEISMVYTFSDPLPTRERFKTCPAYL